MKLTKQKTTVPAISLYAAFSSSADIFLLFLLLTLGVVGYSIAASDSST